MLTVLDVLAGDPACSWLLPSGRGIIKGEFAARGADFRRRKDIGY